MARSASIAGGRARPAALGGLVALTAVAALATLGWQRYQAGSAVGSSPARAALAEVATAAAPSAQPVAAPPAEEKVVEEDEAAAEGEAAADPDKGHAVPRTPTPLDEVAIANVLRQAHELELGSPPTDARLGVAWAHIALENARGEGIENHNFGNLTIWEKEPGAHFVRILRERRPVKRGSTVTRWRWVEMRFRAFETPVEGARAYWAHIDEKFAGALERYDFGDAHGAGLKLARLGYASAFSMRYANSLDNLYDEYRTRIAPQLGGE